MDVVKILIVKEIKFVVVINVEPWFALRLNVTLIHVKIFLALMVKGKSFFMCQLGSFVPIVTES